MAKFIAKDNQNVINLLKAVGKPLQAVSSYYINYK